MAAVRASVVGQDGIGSVLLKLMRGELSAYTVMVTGRRSDVHIDLLVKCGSRVATCFIAEEIAKEKHSLRLRARALSSSLAKSIAVIEDTPGMPGVSGELYAMAVPTAPLLANDPGEVPCRLVEGLPATGGKTKDRSNAPCNLDIFKLQSLIMGRVNATGASGAGDIYQSIGDKIDVLQAMK